MARVTCGIFLSQKNNRMADLQMIIIILKLALSFNGFNWLTCRVKENLRDALGRRQCEKNHIDLQCAIRATWRSYRVCTASRLDQRPADLCGRLWLTQFYAFFYEIFRQNF